MKTTPISALLALSLMAGALQRPATAQIAPSPGEVPKAAPAETAPNAVPEELPGAGETGEAPNPANSTETGETPVAVLPPVTVAELAKLCADGFYDQAVERASQPIAAAAAAKPPGQADGLFFYWRGYAELQVGWFGHARDDMNAAIRAGVRINKGETPQGILDKIARIEAVLPPQTYEVKRGDDTIFRVYYTQDDIVTKTLIDTLPAAYQISSELYGADIVEQPVFIFNTFPEMTTFMAAREATSATSWGWAYGGRDAFFFCLEDPQGKPTASFEESYVRGAVAHEYNHALFRRAMGNVVIPNWFVEGIAVLAESRIAREKEAINDYTLARLLATNALVSPEKLEDHSSFNDHTEAGQNLQRAGLGRIASDPYAQGYNMTRFLLANLNPGELPEFLNQVREAKSFERALQNRFGTSLPEFYQSWYVALRRKL